MRPGFSIHCWLRWVARLALSLLGAGLIHTAAAEATNTPKAEPRQLREDLIKDLVRDDMFRKWGSANDSLGGQMLPPATRPSLTPAQMRELKEQMDAERFWMFADPADAGKSPTLEEQWRLNRTIPGVLDDLTAATPRVLQRYFSRQAQGRSGETNGAARNNDGGYQDRFSTRPEDRWRIRSGLGRSGEAESRTGVETPEAAAASKAISRLFQPNGGRELAVPAAPGFFSAIFSPPAAIPMERTPEAIQRRIEFQKLLESPAAAAAKPLSALPSTTTPGASGFGGLNNFTPSHSGSGLSTPAGGSSLLGASSIPTVTPPTAPSVISQFQPVTPPRRRF